MGYCQTGGLPSPLVPEGQKGTGKRTAAVLFESVPDLDDINTEGVSVEESKLITRWCPSKMILY